MVDASKSTWLTRAPAAEEVEDIVEEVEDMVEEDTRAVEGNIRVAEGDIRVVEEDTVEGDTAVATNKVNTSSNTYWPDTIST